jgi:hypothetical protein
MAAATLNVVNVIDQVRLALNDAANGLGTAGDWLADIDLNRFILNNVISSETTYTLSEYATGLYKHSDGGGSYVWFTSQTAPFTGTADTTYSVYCHGPIVHVTAGTAAETSFSLSGCPVDFNKTVADLFYFLATHRAKDISQSNTAGNLSVDAAANRCLYFAELWTGVTTSG